LDADADHSVCGGGFAAEYFVGPVGETVAVDGLSGFENKVAADGEAEQRDGRRRRRVDHLDGSAEEVEAAIIDGVLRIGGNGEGNCAAARVVVAGNAGGNTAADGGSDSERVAARCAEGESVGSAADERDGRIVAGSVKAIKTAR